MATSIDRFKASLLLSATGDALGYKNGEWEFCYQGSVIHDQLKELGGLNNISVNKKNWRVSDDTVLHIATAEALVSDWSTKEELYLTLADKYKNAMVRFLILNLSNCDKPQILATYILGCTFLV